MNQVKNLIQWKNLTDEQKKDFDFEDYKYDYQSNASRLSAWKPCSGINSQMDTVYRLVIEDDKWYTVAAAGIKDGRPFTTLGSQLESYNLYRILRPAKPDEIPQQEKTLEQKIEDKWPDKEVTMLAYTGKPQKLTFPVGALDCFHFAAVSMKGFYKYVYNEEKDLLHEYDHPTKPWKGKTLQPVAVLSEEVK